MTIGLIAVLALGVTLLVARDSVRIGWDVLPFAVAIAFTARLVATRRQAERADWIWSAGLGFALTAFLAFGAIEAALVVAAGILAGALLDQYASRVNAWPAHTLRAARTVLGILAGGAVAGSAITDPMTQPGDDDLSRFVPFLGIYLLVQLLAVAGQFRAGLAPQAHMPAWMAHFRWTSPVRELVREAVSVVSAALLAIVIDTVGLRLDYWIASLIAFAVLFGINRLLDLNAQLRERNTELRRAMTELRTLNAVGQVLNATIDVDRLCTDLAVQLGRWSQADVILIALIDPARTRVRIAYYAYGGVRQPERFEEMPEVIVGPPTGRVGAARPGERARLAGDGIVSQVLAGRRTVVGGDAERFALVRPDGTVLPADRSGVRQFHSAVGVPLQVAGDLTGALVLKSHQPDAFDDAQVALLGRIGSQAAQAIRNAEIVAGERTAARARQDFLTVVSHELRTPITSIAGYAQLLARRLAREPQPGVGDAKPVMNTRDVASGPTPADPSFPAPPRSQTTHAELVGVISDQSRHLGRLVDDLVTLSGLGQGNMRFEMRPLDIAGIVSDAVTGARLVLDQPDAIGLEAATGLVVLGDRRRLREVFDNLIANAMIYGPSGAPIDVWVGERGGAVEVRVTDHGRGIPMAIQAHVFEPFYRGVEDDQGELRRGLGLGLSISREIVTAHGGTISVLSDIGSGATFIVRLQLADVSHAADADPT